jgi:hypothetical protein
VAPLRAPGRCRNPEQRGQVSTGSSRKLSPATRWPPGPPGRCRLAPGPALSTMPTPSWPGVNGGVGLTGPADAMRVPDAAVNATQAAAGRSVTRRIQRGYPRSSLPPWAAPPPWHCRGAGVVQRHDGGVDPQHRVPGGGARAECRCVQPRPTRSGKDQPVVAVDDDVLHRCPPTGAGPEPISRRRAGWAASPPAQTGHRSWAAQVRPILQRYRAWSCAGSSLSASSEARSRRRPCAALPPGRSGP